MITAFKAKLIVRDILPMCAFWAFAMWSFYGLAWFISEAEMPRRLWALPAFGPLIQFGALFIFEAGRRR